MQSNQEPTGAAEQQDSHIPDIPVLVRAPNGQIIHTAPHNPQRAIAWLFSALLSEDGSPV